MPSPEQVAERMSAKRWQRERDGIMDEIAGRMAEAATALAPRSGRSGHIALADTLVGKVSSSKKEPISVTTSNPAYQELLGWIVNGTPPHIIEASSAQALHWSQGGAEFFARYVEHPGTAPNDFLSRAAADSRDDAERLLKEAAERFLEAVG